VGGFEIDVAGLRRAASQLDAAVDDLDDLIDRFDDQLSSLGDCWGGDDVGSLIGMCYLPGYDTAMACFDNNLEAMADYPELLEQMATEYEQADEASAQGAQDVGRNLGDVAV
jgi:uncharacterized protein YukE